MNVIGCLSVPHKNDAIWQLTLCFDDERFLLSQGHGRAATREGIMCSTTDCFDPIALHLCGGCR